MADTRLIMGFLKELSRNNDRDWFHANKERFQQAQEHFLELIDALIPRLREVDLSIGPVRAADCAFRIYRDTRFSNDKTPYKTHFGAYIAHGGRKSLRAGYYVHLDAEHPMAAGGLWQPSPQVLQAVRQEIMYNLGPFEAILHDKAFSKTFGGMMDEDRLSRPPKGYPADAPGIEYIKNRNFTVARMLSIEEVTGQGLPDLLFGTFRQMAPFNAFLNQAVEMSAIA